jgi:hypothetical protein
VHTTTFAGEQLALLHVVESDDLALENREDVLWFHLFKELDWRTLIPAAVQYYEALWHFNQEQAYARQKQKEEPLPPNTETQAEATLRLIAEGPTFDRTVPIAHEVELPDRAPFHVNPDALRPGVVPFRLVGRRPKDFFSLFKAFLGVPLLGRAAEPENVHAELTNNPSYARACGFTQPDPNGEYHQTDIPSLRKLQQFDQIMAREGIWRMTAIAEVRRNLETGKVQIETELAHDTTGYEGWSSQQKTHLPEELAKQKRRGRKLPKVQTHPKTTKNCRCPDREVCGHPWVFADPGVGVVVKGTGKRIWGHKASTFGFPRQGILLDAVAITDGGVHDSRCLMPHVNLLEKIHPEVLKRVKTILDDGSLDGKPHRREMKDKFDIELITPKNPRSWQEILKNLPNGVQRVKRNGVPVCEAGFPFDFVGRRIAEERFLFRAPDDSDGKPVCEGCEHRSVCLTKGGSRRHLSFPYHRLGMIDPEAPHLSVRYLKKLARRTVIERIHKLMKFDFGDERLRRRGSTAFQAMLDKLLLAMHLAIGHT